MLTKMDKKIRKLCLQDFKDSSSNVRLNSIRYPRDLTLGGTKIHKKEYKPNLNIIRNKNLSCLSHIEKSNSRRRNTQNKLKQSLMQSTGVFSEGIGPTTIFHIEKKVDVKKFGKNTPSCEKSHQELDEKKQMTLYNEIIGCQRSSDSELEETPSFEPQLWNIHYEKKPDEELLGPLECIDSDPKITLWQMPSSLPFKVNMNSSKTHVVDHCLKDLPQGKIGKILIRKSGKIEALFGNIKYNLNSSQMEPCYQTLVTINVEIEKSAVLALGKVDTQYILVPNWSHLLGGN